MSPSEIETLTEMVKEGRTDKEIGEAMHYSLRWVKMMRHMLSLIKPRGGARKSEKHIRGPE